MFPQQNAVDITVVLYLKGKRHFVLPFLHSPVLSMNCPAAAGTNETNFVSIVQVRTASHYTFSCSAPVLRFYFWGGKLPHPNVCLINFFPILSSISAHESFLPTGMQHFKLQMSPHLGLYFCTEMSLPHPLTRHWNASTLHSISALEILPPLHQPPTHNAFIPILAPFQCWKSPSVTAFHFGSYSILPPTHCLANDILSVGNYFCLC